MTGSLPITTSAAEASLEDPAWGQKHDRPATPHLPAIRHEKMRKRPIIALNAAFKRIKPAALSRQILDLKGWLETVSVAKKSATSKLTII